MNYPVDLRYSNDHEWLKIENENIGIVGITHHAQEQLGDVVFVELPEIGAHFDAGDVFGVVESVKAVVDCYMPVSGRILEVNNSLKSQCDLINRDPHDQGWMIKLQLDHPDEPNKLMTHIEYEEYLTQSEG